MVGSALGLIVLDTLTLTTVAIMVSGYDVADGDSRTGERRAPQLGVRRWPHPSDPQWIQVDLGARHRICQVVLNWQNSYAVAFQIQVSDNATAWTPIYSTTTATGGLQTLPVTGSGRYVRVHGTARHMAYGYSLWELQVHGVAAPPILGAWEPESLTGAGNNPFAPSIGSAGTNYTRKAPARYADGKSQMATDPNARYVSNRMFNDTNVNVFSERGVTQWGNVWGQFIDHTIGLRQDDGTKADIPFSGGDALESFTNDLGVVPFTRTAAAPGTGVSNARQQINTVSSYIDAWAVYGGTDARLRPVCT